MRLKEAELRVSKLLLLMFNRAQVYKIYKVYVFPQCAFRRVASPTLLGTVHSELHYSVCHRCGTLSLRHHRLLKAAGRTLEIWSCFIEKLTRIVY